METTSQTAIGKRVSELMFRLGKNQSTFATSIGVSQTTVRNVINGITKPSFEFIETILDVYGNVNSDWLLRGEGEMFKQTEKVVAEPTLWQTLKENYESRIEELQYTISIQKQLLGKLKPVPRRPSAGKVIYFFPDLLEEKIMAAEA